MKYDITFKI